MCSCDCKLLGWQWGPFEVIVISAAPCLAGEALSDTWSWRDSCGRAARLSQVCEDEEEGTFFLAGSVLLLHSVSSQE